MKVFAVLIILSSILISSSHCNIMQVLMSAVSKTLNDKQRLDPAIIMSQAASELEEEEIKDNVRKLFLYIKYNFLY